MTAKIATILLALAIAAQADDLHPPRVYSTGFSIVIKLARDLCSDLPTNYAAQLDPQVVALQPQNQPVIAPIAATDDNRAIGQVCLSAGLIDLVNHICHAKAIDRIQPGFFDQYAKNVARQCMGDVFAQAPDIVASRFWAIDVMNDQQSYFNQTISFLTAVTLSHHYLGHYAKYAGSLSTPGNELPPINNLLTAREWEESIRAGAVDALDCNAATAGPRALFQAIDLMPQRPAWVSYIVPQQVDIKKLNQELATYEADFFHGQLK